MASKNASALKFKVIADTKQLTTGLNRAQKRVRSFSSQVKGMGASLGLAFGGVALASGIRSTIGKIGDFEEQMSKVQAVSRATNSQIKQLRDNALQLGARSKFTATQIGAMQEEMARLGRTTDQIIATTDSVRKLATAAGEELAPSAQALVKVMNAFNLEASQSDRTANIMAESFANTALQLDGFSVAMGNVGATANAAGFSIEQTTAMLGILVDSGIDASKAGTDLRKIFTEISINGLSLEEALNKIVIAENKVSTSFDEFGQRAQTSAIILAENQTRIDELTKSLGDANMEMTKMVDIMEDNLNTDLLKLKSAWDGILLSFGDTSTIRTATQQLTELLGVVTNFLDKENAIDKIEQSYRDLKKQLKETSDTTKIKELRKELERLEEIRSDLLEGNIIAGGGGLVSMPEQVADIIPPIKGLDNEIKKVKSTVESIPKIDIGNKIESKGIEGSASDLGDSELIDEQTAAFQRLVSAMSGVKIVNNELINEQEKLNETALILSETIRSGIGDAFVSLGEDIGNAASGVGSFGDSILRSVAGFMKSFGKQLVAIGIAKLSLDQLFKAGPAGAAAAIAGGVALIAVASALNASAGNQVSALSNGGGGSSGGSSSIPSGRTVGLEQARNNKIEVGGEFRIQGNTLIALLNNQNQTNSRTGGQVVSG